MVFHREKPDQRIKSALVMKRSSIILTIFLVSLFAIITSERAIGQIRPQGNLNFIVGIPQGEFSDQLDQVGYGGNLFAGIGIAGTPVVVGLDLGYLIYGYERRQEPFSSTIPDVTVDVATSNNIALGHFVLRLRAPRGVVQPYVDGLFGGKYLFTETRIENERWDGESIAVSTNFDDWALSYGVGGGLNIRLFHGQIGNELRTGSIHLNLGLRYLVGSEAEYLKEGSIRRENGEVTYDIERSRTDLLIPQFGATISF